MVQTGALFSISDTCFFTCPVNRTSSSTDVLSKGRTSSKRTKTSVLDQQKGKRPLQRSQSVNLPSKNASVSALSTAAGDQAKNCGPLMSICCDCKGMIMEILRASKTSLAMLQTSSASSVSQVSSGLSSPTGSSHTSLPSNF